MDAVALFLAAQEHPNSISPYIALTRESASRIIWPVFDELNERFQIGASLTESDLTVTMPNKSRIFCVGADQKNFVKRLRGVPYPLVVIDETQDFGSHLKELVDDVLTPAIADYDGTIILSGTPGVVPRGYFYDATTRPKEVGFSTHFWTIFDNPFFPNARGFVDRLKKNKGWTEENPTYQREWLGRWVLDMDALVYRFRRDVNCYRELPQGESWYRVLGLDFGWNDQTAFAILAYSPTSPRIYIEHVEGHSQIIPSDIAKRVDQLRQQFEPIATVADTGGLGKSIVQEMVIRYGIPIEPAEKKEKLTNISLLNGDFIDHKLFVHESLTRVMDQYETLRKIENGMEDPSMPNDLVDAILYGYRYCRGYCWQPKEQVVEINSDKWAQKYWEKEAETLLIAEMEAKGDGW